MLRPANVVAKMRQALSWYAEKAGFESQDSMAWAPADIGARITDLVRQEILSAYQVGYMRGYEDGRKDAGK